jgi:hypothetical protein
VDGWALTMLSKKNVEYGSTCNSIGQNLGYFISFVGFLALDNAETCNAYFRPLLGIEPTDVGMVTLGGFFQFFGTVWCPSFHPGFCCASVSPFGCGVHGVRFSTGLCKLPCYWDTCCHSSVVGGDARPDV